MTTYAYVIHVQLKQQWQTTELCVSVFFHFLQSDIANYLNIFRRSHGSAYTGIILYSVCKTFQKAKGKTFLLLSTPCLCKPPLRSMQAQYESALTLTLLL